MPAKTIKIEKSPSLPDKQRYPFMDLKVGMGFTVQSQEYINSIRTQASKYHRKTKRRFVVHLVDGGVTVKRIK